MKKYFHYAWLICFGCMFICGATSPIVNATATQYLKSVTQEFGVSRSAFTLTSTIVALVGMVVSPLWGKIYSHKDKMSWILTLSIAGFGASYASYSLAQNIYHFYISAVVLGFFWAGACFMPVSMMITAWFSKQRGLAMSITLAAISLGSSILAPNIRNLIASYGWRSTYQIIGALIIIIVCPIVFFILKPTPEYKHMLPFGADFDDEPETKKEKKQFADEGNIEIEPADAKKYPFFWIFMVGFFGMGLVCSAPMRQMYPYVSDLYGTAFAAKILATGSLMGIFLKMVLGTLHDKIGNLKASTIAFISFSIAFIILVIAPMFQNAMYGYAFFYALAAGVGTVSAPLLISCTFGTKSFNMMRGITQSPLQAGMSLGGILVASAFDLTGSYTMGWISVAIISIVSAACFWIAHKMSRNVYLKEE